MTRMLTALFEQEWKTRNARVKASQAERAANQAETLAGGLDETRRRLQGTLRELSEAIKAAEEASSAKSQFLANMSHEIRTPLHGVMGMIDLLAQSPLNLEQRRDIEVARTCCRSLLTIIEDVLDFSRIEARKVEIESVAFDLEDVLRSVCAVHSKIAADKSLDFHCDLACPSPWPVTGDPHRFSQILHNLLSNAIKFTATGGVRFHCEATENGEGWEGAFVVEDSGVGIAPETLPLLFEPFQQADASTTRRFGGSGLGLSISKQLVELMGGTIVIESTWDVGSTFTVRLPFRPGTLEREPSFPPLSDLGSLMVLLAEDNPINRGVVSRMLKSRGHEVVEAADGEKAVEIWESQQLDLVLMDMHMPKMDGVEAIRCIRDKERRAGRGRTMMVALTAATSVEDRRLCLQAGADEHLPKPLPAKEFDKVLERARQRSLLNEDVPQ